MKVQDETYAKLLLWLDLKSLNNVSIPISTLNRKKMRSNSVSIYSVCLICSWFLRSKLLLLLKTTILLGSNLFTPALLPFTEISISFLETSHHLCLHLVPSGQSQRPQKSTLICEWACTPAECCAACWASGNGSMMFGQMMWPWPTWWKLEACQGWCSRL